MDILQRIRADFGPPCPLRRLDEVAAEVGMSKWTLRRIARNPNVTAYLATLDKLSAWYARQDEKKAA